jgi:hypothetical protein
MLYAGDRHEPCGLPEILRLNGLHGDLMNSDSAQVIGDMATCWEFWHILQLSVDYMRLFGELASQTVKCMGCRPFNDRLSIFDNEAAVWKIAKFRYRGRNRLVTIDSYLLERTRPSVPPAAYFLHRRPLMRNFRLVHASALSATLLGAWHG